MYGALQLYGAHVAYLAEAWVLPAAHEACKARQERKTHRTLWCKSFQRTMRYIWIRCIDGDARLSNATIRSALCSMCSMHVYARRPPSRRGYPTKHKHQSLLRSHSAVQYCRTDKATAKPQVVRHSAQFKLPRHCVHAVFDSSTRRNTHHVSWLCRRVDTARSECRCLGCSIP